MPVGVCARRRERACALPRHVACDVSSERRMRRSAGLHMCSPEHHIRYLTAPGPPGAVAAAAFSSPAPYRLPSPGPPSLRAVARSLAVI